MLQVTHGKDCKPREVASIWALHCQEEILHSCGQYLLSTQYVPSTGLQWRLVSALKES